MSIRLEITADTAEEFQKHLLSLASRMGGAVPTFDYAPQTQAEAVEGMTQAARESNMAEAIRAQVEGQDLPVGEPEAAAKPTRTRKPKAESAAPVGEAAGSTGQTEPASSAAATEEPKNTTPSTDASDAKALDFDRDVAPIVTGYVAKVGLDAVKGVLDQFGVKRASELQTPEQWQELLDTLADLDGAAQ